MFEDRAKNIFLCGMPGSGKSTLGKKLSNKLNYPFTDLDDLIENSNHLSISQIFSEQGEENFRRIESSTLKKCCESRDNKIIALGGGTPCFHDNLQTIKKNGILVYLQIPVKALHKRINQNPNTRPIFNGLNEVEKENKLNELLKEREKYYLQAELVLNGLDIDLERISMKLKELVQNSSF